MSNLKVDDDAKAIFLEALDKNGADELVQFLDKTCGSDLAMRARVQELLRAHQNAGNFLGKAGQAVDNVRMTERPGTVIGPYKLLEQIGEGGFGVVFMAEQQQPVRRKVALKVIKPGMDSRQVVARFEAERQALALMDHPNIAHVFDGGETAAGRPYFVMELVRGIPITEFCDQNRLPLRERLELFITVCQAVQHAHQKGIIHRDLKPTNVLVTMHDAKAVVKVIDFGIAKATGQVLTEKTLFTNFAQLIGTPVYMSPEQAQMSGLDLDTRSDIFSLGVLLYELLTSTTPFNKERLETAGYDEMRRIIREEEPLRPSQRISTLGATLTVVSAQRKADPRRLGQLFRGELDWIVMKALEKDRNRRYETASAFAADVERYLKDEQVQACPPSVGYRLRKLARRHKGPLLAAALVFAALVAGIIGTTWGMIRAMQAEQKAQDALERTEREQDAAVQALRETFDALIDLSDLNSERLMKDLRPMSLPEQEFFTRMEARYERLAVLLSDAEDTRVRSESRQGATGMKVGDVNRGRLAWQRAASLYRVPLPANSANTAVAPSDLRVSARRCRAVALAAEKLRRWPEAIEFARRQIELAQAALLPGEALDLELFNLRLTGNWVLTVSLTAAGRFDEALTCWEELVHVTGLVGPVGVNFGACDILAQTARTLAAAGKVADADAVLASPIAERQAKLKASPAAADARVELRRAHRVLGLIHERSRRFDAALAAFDRAIAVAEVAPAEAASLGTIERDLIAGSLLGQAICLDALGREAAGNLAWEAFYRFTGDSVSQWCAIRALRLAWNGQAERAVRVAEEIVLQSGRDPQYDAACVYATASADPSLSPQRKEQLARRAVELLTNAKEAGQFRPELMTLAKTDADLNPIRHRDDFKKLMASLERGKTNDK
jgi:serine/threonine protein kinase